MILQDVMMSTHQAQTSGEILAGLWPLVLVLITGLSVMVGAYSKVLSNRLGKQSSRIDELQKRNDDLQKKLEAERDESNILRQQVIDKEAERIRMEYEHTLRYETLKDEFEGKLGTALARIGDLDAQLGVVTRARENLEGQLTTALQEGDRLRQQNRELTQLNEELKQRVDRLLEDARKKTDEITLLTSTNEGLIAERDALVQKAAERDGKIQLLEDCNKRLTESVDELRLRVDELTNARSPEPELTIESSPEGE